MRQFLLALDPWLIAPYRWLDGSPVVAFLVGTFLLGLLCTLLGDVISLLAQRLNRKTYGGYMKDMVHNHNLSIAAAKTGNKSDFKAVNSQAHDAFGKYFFSQAAVFTSSILPLPFALAWMDMRFHDVRVALPLIDFQAGYVFFFIPLYILARFLYSRIMRRMSWYARLWAKTVLDIGEEAERPKAADEDGPNRS